MSFKNKLELISIDGELTQEVMQLLNYFEQLTLITSKKYLEIPPTLTNISPHIMQSIRSM